jgi:hypothetical protein
MYLYKTISITFFLQTVGILIHIIINGFHLNTTKWIYILLTIQLILINII